MEGFISKKQNYTLSSSPPTSLAIHKNSHSISKSSNNVNKPKIRIIHIFAPEIIKTDVENFRELVQRLTGKPTEKDCSKKKITKPRISRRDQDDDDHYNDIGASKKTCPISKPLAKKMMDMNKSTSHGLLGFDTTIDHVRDQRVKEEEQEEIWNINAHNNVSGGFLDRFDIEGFNIEELEFPLLPSLLNPNLDATSHLQYGFGPQLA